MLSSVRRMPRTPAAPQTGDGRDGPDALTGGRGAFGEVWSVVTDRLRRAGCVDARDEARALVVGARGSASLLEQLLLRREQGEPLSWILGWTSFGGLRLRTPPGVYVPRPHTWMLVTRAREVLPDAGIAVDLCTGSGAVAAALQRSHPAATIVATDLARHAISCARSNGVDARHGDLFTPLPDDLRGFVDVVVGVVPYVPTPALTLLPRDTLAFEASTAYDGGPDGTDLLRRAATDAVDWLRPGGHLALELGGDQADVMRPLLATLGYVGTEVLTDDEDDPRAIVAARPS